jgi:hypothetical protein
MKQNAGQWTKKPRFGIYDEISVKTSRVILQNAQKRIPYFGYSARHGLAGPGRLEDQMDGTVFRQNVSQIFA